MTVPQLKELSAHAHFNVESMESSLLLLNNAMTGILFPEMGVIRTARLKQIGNVSEAKG